MTRSPNAATLSGDTKDALAREVPASAHCRAALLDGLARYGASPDGAFFRTRRPAVARLFRALVAERGDRPIVRVPGTRLYRTPSYEIDLEGIAPAVAIPAARCDRRMELRAAFLGCGSLSTPARGYHLEFVPPAIAIGRLERTLRAEGIVPRRSTRAGRDIIYFKDVDAIAAFFAAIGASAAVFALEDARAVKETKNRIRRLVNTEAANVDRSTRAAAGQARAIAHLVDAYGMRNLSKPLRDAAALRLEFPDESLAELGRRCDPPVRKSTFGGRIAALVRLARTLDGAPKKGSTRADG